MFYTFKQNNSGGYDIIDKKLGVGKVMIIEAADEKQAEIFHDGFGFDCCGYRWRGCDDGTDAPTIYGEDAFSYKGWMIEDNPAFVHYLNGEIKRIDMKGVTTLREKRTV